MTHRFSTVAIIGMVVAFTTLACWGQQTPEQGEVRSVTESEATIKDDFGGSLDESWRWLRENKAGWRIVDSGLEVLVEPGNMWGAANNARNVLLRRVPEGWENAVTASVQLTHHPKKRWEQANLVWYYSDSAMVKLGLEIENGITNIVMGREEGDKTRTVVIIPYAEAVVQLRLKVAGREIRGYFRHPDSLEWTEAGVSTLPSPSTDLPPQISLQFYQGEAGSNRWARVNWFEMTKQ